MENEKILVKITLKRDGVKKDDYKQLVFPMSDQEFDDKIQELSSIKSARYILLNNLDTNLPITSYNYNYILKKVLKNYGLRYNFNDPTDIFCLKDLNMLLQILNEFSSLIEICAIAELITDDIEEIIKIIRDGRFCFYPYMSLLDKKVRYYILEDPIPYCDDEQDNPYMQEENVCILQEYADKGYFQTSIGVLLIQDKYLYYKARTKWEEQKKELEQASVVADI